MRMRAPNRLATVVAGSAMIVCLRAAPAGAAPAGKWTIEGTATARYRYEGRHGHADFPFATRMVVADDGTIDGVVTDAPCNASTDPIPFTGRWSRTGRPGVAAALRAFVVRCYGPGARLAGVRSRVRLSANATRLTAAFDARLRLPIAGENPTDAIAVSLHAVVGGTRADRRARIAADAPAGGAGASTAFRPTSPRSSMRCESLLAPL